MYSIENKQFFYKKNHFRKVINILYFFKIVLIFLLLIPSPSLLAISQADLISNTDHTRLTVNPASLGGINEGIFQSQLSPCRPLVSL